MVQRDSPQLVEIPPTIRGDGVSSELRDESSPSHSLAFTANAARPYAPVPVILGRHRVIPPLGAKVMTEVSGSELFQRLVVLWGYGPLRISDIRISNTPIAEFDDISIETRQGRTGDAAVTLYPGTIFQTPLPMAYSAIRVRVTDQLPRTVNEISGIVESECLDWNDGNDQWALGRTSNPASLMRYALQHPARTNRAADSLLDLAALQSFHEFCDDNGYEFNAIHDFRGSIWDLVTEICAVARATPTLSRGKWSIVTDTGTQSVADHFTAVNTRNFGIQRSYRQAPHGYRVRFSNRNRDWRRDERIVYRDGFSDANATNVPTLSPAGITDPDHAWKWARYRLAQHDVREEWSFDASLENLLIDRGDLVTCQHDVLNVGVTTARVLSVQTDAGGRATGVTLDAAVFLEEDVQHRVKFRTSGNKNLILPVTERGPNRETDTLTFRTPSGSTIEPGSLATVGTTGSLQAMALVRDIERRENMEATVSLIPFNVSIYDAEGGDVPAFTSALEDLAAPLPPMVISRLNSGATVNQRLGNILEPRIVVGVNAIPVAGVRIEAEIRESGESDWSAADIRAQYIDGCILASVQAGTSYNIRCRWVLPEENRVGAWDDESHTVARVRPDPVTNFAVAVVAGGSRAFTYRPPRADDLAGIKIKYASSSSTAWADMTDLHEGLLTASPYYSYIPAAGTYSFEARAVSADGVESTGVRVEDVSLGEVRALGRFHELTAFRKQAVTAAAPARPGASGSYNFETGAYAPPTGWVASWPAHTQSEVVYAIAATAQDSEGNPWNADNNDWSDPAIISDAGDINIIYRRLTVAGNAPGSSTGVPTGWYDEVADVPAGTGYIYVSIGLRRRGTTLFVWQKPEQLEGQEGADGIDGATWTGGTNVPGNSLGKDGDYYLRTTTSQVYRKESGAWVEVVNLAGADGATWYTGAGQPGDSLGVVGDWYFRTGTGPTAAEIYTKFNSVPFPGAITGTRVSGQTRVTFAGGTPSYVRNGDFIDVTTGGSTVTHTITSIPGNRNYVVVNTGSAFTASGGIRVRFPSARWVLEADIGQGATWHAAENEPDSALGVEGDFYFRTDNGYVYEKTDATTWTFRRDITGPQGSIWLQGTEVPANDLGRDGDLYLRTSTGQIYRKSSGAWSFVTNLSGADGATWHSGTGVPAATLGVDGDWYFREGAGTTAAEIYLKESGSWSQQIDIDQGQAGEDGATWHTGSGVPADSLGAIGDFYFRTDNGFVYEKT